MDDRIPLHQAGVHREGNGLAGRRRMRLKRPVVEQRED